MTERSATSSIVLAALAAVCACGGVAAGPLQTPLEEQVTVAAMQFEVTAWPRSDDFAACRELRLDGIEIYDGEWWTAERFAERTGRRFTIDRLGDAGTGATLPPEHDWLLFFDEPRLPECFPAATAPRARAYAEAREMIETVFDPAHDRLMLAAHLGGDVPEVTEWFHTREEALAALLRFERREPSQRARSGGPRSLWTSLGIAVDGVGADRRVGADAVLLVLAADLPVDAATARDVAALNATLAVNHVTPYTIDLRRTLRSGLYGLDLLSNGSGGHHFDRTDTLSSAALKIDTARANGCRLLVTVPARSIDTLRVDLKDPRFRVSVVSRTALATAAVRDRQREARRLRPRWGSGLALRSRLWPYAREGDVTKAVLVTDVALGADLPDAVTALRVVGVLEHASLSPQGAAKARGDATFRIEVGPERLAALRARGSWISVVPVELHRERAAFRVGIEDPASANGAQVQDVDASTRSAWAMVNGFREVRVGASADVQPVPVFETRVPEHAPALFAGYRCASEPAAAAAVAGSNGEVVMPVVPLERIGSSCWYRAEVDGLPPASYELRLPDEFGVEPVRFSVVPRETASAH